jgi:HK97 family phage major capsid protein
MMGTRRGITIATSEHIYFETDEIGIRGTERFDINVHDIGDTTNAGPIVALIGE